MDEQSNIFVLKRTGLIYSSQVLAVPSGLPDRHVAHVCGGTHGAEGHGVKDKNIST